MPSGKWRVGNNGAVGLQIGEHLWVWLSHVTTKTDQKPLLRINTSQPSKEGEPWQYGQAYFFEMPEARMIMKKLNNLASENPES